MKIMSIDVCQIPSGNAGAKRGAWSPVIVRVNTDEGISGFGEVGLAYGKGFRAGYGMVLDFAETIIGENPMNSEKIWQNGRWNSYFGGNEWNRYCTLGYKGKSTWGSGLSIIRRKDK